MYQQQPPPEALLPHERVRPGCVIGSIVGLILFWLYFTILEIFIGNIWAWLLATGLCIALVGLLIMWLEYAKRRQREVQAAWYTWQQRRQAFAAYQDQQMQRFYASLEEQQRRQEEQQRRQEEQRRRQEEQQRKASIAYQEQLMRRNYAYQEEQRGDDVAWTVERRDQEEQRRSWEEQQRKERLAVVKTLGDLLVLSAS